MKKFTLFLILTITLLCNTAFSQWTQVGYMAIGPDTANTVNMYTGFGANLYSASNKGIFRSTDNGNTWTGLTYTTAVTQTLTMLSVYEESVSTIYAGSDKRLYKSTNSGSSWTWVPLPLDSIEITDILRSGNNLVVSYKKSFSSGGVFYSSNNGLTWSASTGIPAANYMQDMIVEGDTVYVGGKNGMFKSADKGVTFAALGIGLPTARTITRHSGNLFAGDGGGSGLYISTNNGLTWGPANASVFGGFCQVFSIEQAPGMILAAVSGATCSGSGTTSVQMSADGGSTWVPFMSGLITSFYAKIGTNSTKTSFFTNKGNKIYRTNASTGIKDHSAVSEMKLFFDAEKNLNIQIANSTNLDVKIFSVAGSLLYENTFSGSEIKVSELANADQGVYFVMLSSGNKVISQKVLKQE